MKATVFIPTGNRGTSLKKTLRSLVKQTYKDFEVIVVDYRSVDSTARVVESFRNQLSIRILHQKTKGLAKAANLALKFARGSIFIRTDDDVMMSKNWLRSIITVFLENRSVGGVTGPTVIPTSHLSNRDLFSLQKKMKKGSFLWRFCGWIYFHILLDNRSKDVSEWLDSGAFTLGSNYPHSLKVKPHSVTNLEACNFSVRTNLLRKIGGFDTRYVGVGEYHEPDAAFKIRALGYELMFHPHASLNHLPSQDGFFNDRPASYSRMTNFIRFYKKHIKCNSARKLLHFTLYLLFLNTYFLYIGIRTKQVKQFGAIPGTIRGLLS